MDAMKVIKLDLLSVRPYFTIKNLIILVGLGVLYGALSKNTVTVLATAQMFAILFSSYPFMVGEESGIDPLYKLFNIDSKDVVKGRYLLAALFVGVMVIIGAVLAIITTAIFEIEDGYQIILLTAPVGGLVTLFIIFIEYPIYFKHGYKKGKTLVMIPLLLMVVLGIGFSFFGEQLKIVLEFFTMNLLIGTTVILAVWIMVLILSVRFSNKLYAARDF